MAVRTANIIAARGMYCIGRELIDRLLTLSSRGGCNPCMGNTLTALSFER